MIGSNTAIGIIGAMDEEIKLLLDDMTGVQTFRKAGIVFHSGEAYGRHLIVCKSGVGKVNAAVATQLLIDRFGAGMVLFTGVAGALHEDLDIGDVVISSECQQHDMDVSPLGYPLGVIPYQESSVFPADPGLVLLAEQACRKLKAHYVTGKVLSGDQFIASRETVSRLRLALDGVCAEMEGAAVAQVCSMNDIPYLVIRAMSDRADGSAHVNYMEFTAEASARSHAILQNMLYHLEEWREPAADGC